MGNTGPNTGVTRWGTGFSSLRRTRRKRRLANIEKGRRWSVYFIQADDGMVKIGYAANPWTRLATLQSSNPQRLNILVATLGDPVAEERLHAAFACDRRVGEWFAPSEALVAFIGELQQAVDWMPDPFP